MIVVDSCGWLERFAGSPCGELYAEALQDPGDLLVPVVRLIEVFRTFAGQTGERGARFRRHHEPCWRRDSAATLPPGPRARRPSHSSPERAWPGSAGQRGTSRGCRAGWRGGVSGGAVGQSDERVVRVATGGGEHAAHHPRDDVARPNAGGVDDQHQHEDSDEGDRPDRDDRVCAVPHVPPAVEALEGRDRDDHRAREQDVPPRWAGPERDPAHPRSRRHEDDRQHEAANVDCRQRDYTDGATQAVHARELRRRRQQPRRWKLSEPVATGVFRVWALSAKGTRYRVTRASMPVVAVAGATSHSARWKVNAPAGRGYRILVELWWAGLRQAGGPSTGRLTIRRQGWARRRTPQTQLSRRRREQRDDTLGGHRLRVVQQPFVTNKVVEDAADVLLVHCGHSSRRSASRCLAVLRSAAGIC